jgi:hypothetical protein
MTNDQLMLALEPEAASIYCRRQVKSSQAKILSMKEERQ